MKNTPMLIKMHLIMLFRVMNPHHSKDSHKPKSNIGMCQYR